MSSSCPIEGENSVKTSECQQGHSARLCRLYIAHLQGDTFLCKPTNLLTVSHNIPEGTRCPVARFPFFRGSVRMWPSGQVFGRLTSNKSPYPRAQTLFPSLNLRWQQASSGRSSSCRAVCFLACYMVQFAAGGAAGVHTAILSHG